MESIFGFFDDDDEAFEEAFGDTKKESKYSKDSEDKFVPKLVSYNAKICTSEWFLEEAIMSEQTILAKDPLDQVVIRKYRGDRLYLNGQYGSALAEYCKGEEKVPRNNAPVLRDVLEAKVRCAIRLKQWHKTDDDMFRLKSLASSPANRVALCNLELEIFERRGDSLGLIQTLERLVSLLPLSADLWFKLALTLEKAEEEEEDRETEEDGAGVNVGGSCACLCNSVMGNTKNPDISHSESQPEASSTHPNDVTPQPKSFAQQPDNQPDDSTLLASTPLPPPPPKPSPCRFRLTRQTSLFLCLLWAKLCLQFDFPSLAIENVEISNDFALDGSSNNFALDKAASSLKRVEVKLKALKFDGESQLESSTKMIGNKMGQLPTFDDHAKEFHGCQFYEFFFHNSGDE